MKNKLTKVFWEFIDKKWIKRLEYLPIHFGRFESEITNLKTTHTTGQQQCLRLLGLGAKVDDNLIRLFVKTLG